MKTQTIKIKHKHGHDTVKGNGTSYRLRLSSGEVVTGTMQPTFGYRLRRFFKRLFKTVAAKIDEAANNALVFYNIEHSDPEPVTADIPIIGLIEERNVYTREIKMGWRHE